MGRRRGEIVKKYLLRDLALSFGKFSGASLDKQILLLRATFDVLAETICRAEPNSRIIITGLGTFDIRPIKHTGGNFIHYKTKQKLVSKPTGYRVVFVPSIRIKQRLKKR